MGYTKDLVIALAQHGARWWATLVAAYILGGVGVFAEYPTLRDTINGWLEKPIMPTEFPLWLIVVPALVWLIAASTHKDVIRNRTGPLLIFDPPDCTPMSLEVQVPVNDPGLKDKGVTHEITYKKICLGRISVRNNPVSKRGAIGAINAHATVSFYSRDGAELLKEMNYPRWTDNPKPRPDTTPKYMPGPKYNTDWNFRTLEPNNAHNGIDFVLKDLETDEIFGFQGPSQDFPFWQNESLKLPGHRFKVRLIIEAAEMQETAEEWLIIQDPGKGELLNIQSLRSLEWLNWVGVG